MDTLVEISKQAYASAKKKLMDSVQHEISVRAAGAIVSLKKYGIQAYNAKVLDANRWREIERFIIFSHPDGDIFYEAFKKKAQALERAYEHSHLNQTTSTQMDMWEKARIWNDALHSFECNAKMAMVDAFGFNLHKAKAYGEKSLEELTAEGTVIDN